MKRISTLAILALFTFASVRSQTADLVFFSDDGAKFTLLVDGDVKNDVSAARVIATGIRNESPVIIIRFDDSSIPQVRKSAYFPMGKEYTVMVTTNKKGERVIRPTGEAELGTTAKVEPSTSRPVTFVEDAPSTGTNGATKSTGTGSGQEITTVTTIEESSGSSTGENVSINMAMGGVGVNMDVKVDDGSGGASTTTKTTTTRTTTVSSTSSNAAVVAPDVAEVKEPEAYRMPGYNGPVGCAMPMSSAEFGDAKKSIETQGFEDTRMTMAKQVGRDRCFSSEQVRSMMGVFSFEDTRLDFAKFAYDRTHDLGNYYKVNDAFSFSSSVEDLNEYISSR